MCQLTLALQRIGVPGILTGGARKGRLVELLRTRHPKLNAAIVLILAGALTFAGCAHRGKPTIRSTPEPQTVEEGWTEKGIASWYGEPYHGRRTASGEVYDMHELTAAHKTLAFDTLVRVTRRDTKTKVEVRINDRGPFIAGRIIDLSYAAAKNIELDIDGVAPVKIEVIGPAESNPGHSSEALQEASDDDCFWVQVGAFSSRDNARRAEQRLEASGETTLVMEGYDDLYRVRIGPFDRKNAAEKAKERVLQDWPQAHVVSCGG